MNVFNTIAGVMSSPFLVMFSVASQTSCQRGFPGFSCHPSLIFILLLLFLSQKIIQNNYFHQLLSSAHAGSILCMHSNHTRIYNCQLEVLLWTYSLLSHSQEPEVCLLSRHQCYCDRKQLNVQSQPSSSFIITVVSKYLQCCRMTC